ncbi:hypothetical protein BH11PSE3_BH11PSE3_17080 [soil metagenome]
MTSLYRIEASADEIAGHFGLGPLPDLIVPRDIKPGETGLVVRTTGVGRVLQRPRWGFPRPHKEGDGHRLPAKPLNLATDLTHAMWDKMAADPRYRCLIPATAFAQPEGPPGSLTRTWFSVPDWPILAVAGFCRALEPCGPVYAALTCDSNAAVGSLNPQMPVILAPDEYDRWLEGSIADVIEFQMRRPVADECLEIDRTDELWVPRRHGRTQAGQSAFLV